MCSRLQVKDIKPAMKENIVKLLRTVSAFEQWRGVSLSCDHAEARVNGCAFDSYIRTKTNAWKSCGCVVCFGGWQQSDNRVNVKARTHEKVDSVGECRALECHVVLTLERV